MRQPRKPGSIPECSNPFVWFQPVLGRSNSPEPEFLPPKDLPASVRSSTEMAIVGVPLSLSMSG